MILFALLTAHLLADFTLQPSKLARLKTEDFKYLLLHSIIYALLVGVVCFATLQPQMAAELFVIIVLSHFVVDFVRVKLDVRFTSGKAQLGSFVADQLIHIAVIIVSYFALNATAYKLLYFERIVWFYYARVAIVCAFIVVAIWDPVSVFIKKLFTYLFNEPEQCDDNEPSVGSLIGKLERLIIVVLVLSNQIGGIGFVLTAKSIARFKQFEEREFAKQFLVGTLTSTCIAMIVSLVLRVFI